MTWTAPDIDPKGGSTVAPERELLEGYLDWQRESFLAKCAGLTGEQLATRAAAPSNLSLLGLIRHFTKVERVWFRQRVAQQDVEPLFGWGTDRRDEDFDDLDPARAQTEYAALVTEVRLAREAAAGFTLDEVFDSGRNGLYSLRMIYVHMIGEYAQHNGHADIVREHLDGITTT